MPDPKGKPLIVYLGRNQLSLYAAGFTTVASLPLPDTILKNSEITEVAPLETLLKNAVAQLKLVPGPVYIILAQNLEFTQDFAAGNCQINKAAADEFLKKMPFDYLHSHCYEQGKGCRIIAINGEIFEVVRSILENLSFTVISATPSSTLHIKNLASGLTVEICNQLLHKLDTVRQNSLVTTPSATAIDEQKSSDPRRNRKLLILLAIFIFLGIVLIAVFFYSQQNEKKTPPAAPTPAPSTRLTSPTPSTVGSSTTATPGAEVDKTKFRLEVLNASGQTGLAASVKKQLEDLGFKSVTANNSPTVNSGKISLDVLPVFPAPLRELISASIQKSLGQEITVREVTGLNFDAVITLVPKLTP